MRLDNNFGFLCVKFEVLIQISDGCTVYVCVLSLFSLVRLCDPIDGSPPGSPIPGILQARTLEWVAISFSNAWKGKVKVKLLSHVWLCNPMDCSPPGSSVHGILQARILEWVAIPFSRGSSQPRGWTNISYVSSIGRQVLHHLSHQGSQRHFSMSSEIISCFPY